jgi:hypothetical protein
MRPSYSKFRSGCDILSLVMRGLDPRTHADWPQAEGAAWIAGSSGNGEWKVAIQFKWKVAIQFNQNMLSREEMAMRDPSLVASKADIRQQAIKGGEVPEAAIDMPAVPSFLVCS